MTGKIVRLIVYGITLCILYGILNYLNNRGTVKLRGEREAHYIVKIPDVLKYISLFLFALGIIMFITFLISKLRGNPTATNGHLWLSLVVAAIGILIMILVAQWKVIVNGNQMEIYRLFHRKEAVRITEIDKVEIGKKGQMILYRDGKKLVTIDGLADNYDTLRKTLVQYGKMK